jgi:hypothetical protein
MVQVFLPAANLIPRPIDFNTRTLPFGDAAGDHDTGLGVDAGPSRCALPSPRCRSGGGASAVGNPATAATPWSAVVLAARGVFVGCTRARAVRNVSFRHVALPVVGEGPAACPHEGTRR